MIKLHGMGRSNYYSLTKAAFLEKGVEFEEVNAMPSQDEDYLAKSPMGKVPCIETEQGFISETFAIADYLDRIQPERPLLPTNDFERAKTIELIRHMELDVELVARRVLPAAFFGATASAELKNTTRKDLTRGIIAVNRLLVCDPWVRGSNFTLADLYAFYSYGLATAVVQKIYGTNLLEEAPKIAELMGPLAERDSIKAVEAAKAG